MSGGEVISQKESEYWSKMYRYELSQNLQWKIGSPYLLSLGYQIDTLPFNDSEPLAPWTRWQDHFFSFLGLHLTTPKNSNDCSDQRMSSDYPSLRHRRGNLRDGLAYRGVLFGGHWCCWPAITLLKSRWSNLPGPGLLVLCLKLGLVWAPL